MTCCTYVLYSQNFVFLQINDYFVPKGADFAIMGFIDHIDILMGLILVTALRNKS